MEAASRHTARTRNRLLSCAIATWNHKPGQHQNTADGFAWQNIREDRHVQTALSAVLCRRTEDRLCNSICSRNTTDLIIKICSFGVGSGCHL